MGLIACRAQIGFISLKTWKATTASESPKNHCVGGEQRGGENAIHIFPHFPHFFSHFPGRSLSVMFKRKYSSGIVL